MANRTNRQSGKNRRNQSRKAGNRHYIDAMIELRKSSATSPVPSGTKYNRKSKHVNRRFQEN